MVPTPDETDEVATLAAAHTGTIDRSGRLPDELVAALRRAGLLSLALPERLGGRSAGLPGTVGVLRRLAAADASTAWTVMISTHGPAALARLGLLDEAYDGSSGRLVAGAAAPSGRLARDGRRRRVWGRWRFVSAVDLADRVLLGCDGGRMALVDAGTVEVTRRWDAVGLRGTGSHDIAVDTTVRPDMCGSPSRPSEPDRLIQLGVGVLLPVELAAIAVGLADASATSASDRQASADLSGWLDDLASRLDLPPGRPLPGRLAAEAVADAQTVCQSAVALVHRCWQAASADVARLDDPFGRRWRDAQVVAKHPAAGGR